MKKNVKSVPEIRFPGFTDLWELRKVGDLAGETYGGGTPKTSIEKYWNGPIPWIQSSDITEHDVNNIHPKKFISDEAIEKSATKLVPENSIAMVTRVGVGKLVIMPFSYATSQDFLSLSKLDSDVLCTAYLLYKKMQNELHAVQGTSIKGITKEELLMKKVMIPQLDEQNKIGLCFKNLDDLIAFQETQCKVLKDLKKCMLQKMFPKDGSDTPAIRFSGFTDSWEQRKLLSCIEKITDFRGRTPKKLGMDWSESGYLALSALNVKDGYIDFSQDVHYGEQALYDKWMSGNELHKGQVLFTTEAPMGNVAQVPDNKRYILSQRTIAFDVKEDIITENFLATLLRSPAVFNTLTSLSSGGTAKGVSQKSLAGVDIQIPVELREQELLATYFANLDNLITLQERKCKVLQKLKKCMLQKMFV